MIKKKRSSEKRSSAGGPAIPELLAPAGNLEKLVTAVHYGADAVYLGGKNLSLRAKAGNFSLAEMERGLDYAHRHGCKVYAAVNILAHEEDFEGLPEYLRQLEGLGVDGLIVADPGILREVRRTVGNIPVHLSTQANVTNARAAEFWFRQGVSRINLARELSLAEIRRIRGGVAGELEVFVHGALCISYSGRCLLSNYLTGRDANRGGCAHPCRFSYSLVEEKRPGQYFPVVEDERGTYIFNSRDLCLLRVLPELIAAGVDALKIEGRMKSIFYVGGVVRVYRAALDYLAGLPAEVWRRPETIELPEEMFAEIARTGTRGMSENFFRGRPAASEMLYHASRAEQAVEPVAVVREGGTPPGVEIRNRLRCGEEVEYMGRGLEVERVRVTALIGAAGERFQAVNPGSTVVLETEPPLAACEAHGIFRRRKAALGTMAGTP